MSNYGSWKIVGDFLTFTAQTTDPTTGAAIDADSLPTYRIYEDETGTPVLSGTMAFLDAGNTTGYYSERVALSSLTKGKSYNGRIEATVGGVTGAVPFNFQIEAEVSVNSIAASVMAALVDLVWDEVITGAAHNVQNSAGRRLRQASSIVIIDGTCPSAPLLSNQIILNGDASADDGAYDPAQVFIVTGTGAGQTRLILEYDGATKTATLDRNWKMDPDDTSEYRVASHPGREHVNEGLAQAGSTLNTIKLNVLASSNNNAYKGQVVFLRSGTGEDQAGKIISYNGTTKVATVENDWVVIPDGTTAYVMLPTGSFDTSTLINSIFAFVVEGGQTFKKVLRYLLAYVGGITTDANTASPKYRDQADGKNRIVGTIDSDGNRDSVSLDGDD